MDLVIGIGECVVSGSETDRLLTFALASCVAVTAFSPLKRAAGMIHLALPSPLDKTQFTDRPCYYATTGLPVLFDKLLRQQGCHPGELRIGLFGGADSINSNDMFNIGRRNIQAVRATLDSLGVNVSFSDLGGGVSRSLCMDVSTGAIKMTTQPISI